MQAASTVDDEDSDWEDIYMYFPLSATESTSWDKWASFFCLYLVCSVFQTFFVYVFWKEGNASLSVSLSLSPSLSSSSVFCI